MGTVHVCQAKLTLFAQDVAVNWEFYLAAAALFGVLGLGLWAILKVKRWREEESDEEGQTPQQLDHYQKMVNDGLLDPEEFARIQAQIETRSAVDKLPLTPPPPDSNQPPDGAISEK